MALSGATSPGLPCINSVYGDEADDVGIEKKPILPLTAFHRVGIVSMYSYNDIVNPMKQMFGPVTKVVRERHIP